MKFECKKHGYYEAYPQPKDTVVCRECFKERTRKAFRVSGTDPEAIARTYGWSRFVVNRETE